MIPLLYGPALLFCPADRPDRYQKASAAAAVVILDLEDGVRPDDRVVAREALVAYVLDPERTVVRINSSSVNDHALDLEALRATPYRMVMLSKTEFASQVTSLSHWLVIALCETPLGVINSAEIAAAPQTVAMMWGAEDLIASMGGRSSRNEVGRYRDVARRARSQVLIAAKAYGKAAIDAVHLDFGDLEGLRVEARDAANSGFDGTACIHPSQVDIVREAFQSSARDVEWARSIIEISKYERGAFQFQGKLVDEPLLRQAAQILEQDSRLSP